MLGIFGYPTKEQSIFAGEERKTLGFVFLASIPTAVIGLTIDQIGIQVFGRPELVGGFFILTGMVLWMGRGGQGGRGIGIIRFCGVSWSGRGRARFRAGSALVVWGTGCACRPVEGLVCREAVQGRGWTETGQP